MFHYVLYNVPFIFCEFIFYDKIALQSTSCVMRMLVAMSFTANVLIVKIWDTLGQLKIGNEIFLE